MSLLGIAQADTLLEATPDKDATAPTSTSGGDADAIVTVADLDNTVQELQKWIDLTDSKVS